MPISGIGRIVLQKLAAGEAIDLGREKDVWYGLLWRTRLMGLRSIKPCRLPWLNTTLIRVWRNTIRPAKGL